MTKRGERKSPARTEAAEREREENMCSQRGATREETRGGKDDSTQTAGAISLSRRVSEKGRVTFLFLAYVCLVIIIIMNRNHVLLSFLTHFGEGGDAGVLGHLYSFLME